MKAIFSGKYSWITFLVIGAIATYAVLYFTGKLAPKTTTTTATTTSLPNAD